VIPFVIDMMNSVYSLPMDLPTDFTDGINSASNSVGKSWHVIIFFCFVLIFFPTVIPSVFPFVFIDFLVVYIETVNNFLEFSKENGDHLFVDMYQNN